MNALWEERDRLVLKADGSSLRSRRPVIREHTLRLSVNGKLLHTITCTRENLKELAAGRLLTDGMIRTAADIREIVLSDEEREASVLLKEGAAEEAGQNPAGDILWEKAAARSPEDGYGEPIRKRNPEKKRLPRTEWRPEWVFSLAERFAEGMPVHRQTQGTHSCFLSVREKLLFACEDISRHNAADKAIGYMLLHGLDPGECILFTSGRVPEDMVQKAASAGIPVLASKSVPTEQALNLAREYGLTLICRAYPDQMDVYE